MALTKQDILDGLRALGVRPGQVIMAHSALSAFGEVAGGEDTVIDALLSAVGPEGTLLMPAMASMPVFDVTVAKSNVGIITDTFWRRPEVIRSIHPTHSAAGIGPLAAELLAGHVQQDTALGPESPWGRLTRLDNAYILLLGCDQDRNTLLHAAEEAVDAPYLSTLVREYLDENCTPQTATLRKFPGPHRDFIRLDRVFREAGVMQVAKIGKATCRMMSAGGIFAVAVEELRRDPAAVLCDNPNCDDCVMQRGKIRRSRLEQEDFTLCARLDDAVRSASEIRLGAAFLGRLGVRDVEIGEEIALALASASEDDLRRLARTLVDCDLRVRTVSTAPVRLEQFQRGPADSAAFEHAMRLACELGADFLRLHIVGGEGSRDPASTAQALDSFARLAAAEGLRLLIENSADAPWNTKARCEQILGAVTPGNVRLGFNPAEFAHTGEHPFLQTYYRGELKKHVSVLYISDGCAPPAQAYTLPGRGKGEVKELMSILRCRSFDGLFCLKPGVKDEYPWATMQAQWEAFWHLMDAL